MIFETSSQSKIERSIHNILRKNFLEQRSITWKPIKVELIVNTQLTNDFFGKYIFSSKITTKEYLNHVHFRYIGVQTTIH